MPWQRSFNKAIKKPVDSRLQRLAFLTEKILLRPSHFPSLTSMNVKSINRYWNRILPYILNPSVRINQFLVIDKVLEMIRITAFPALTQKNDSLAHKNPPFGFFTPLVDQFMSLP